MPFLIRFTIYVCVTLVLGLGSASFLTNSGFYATTLHFGPWSLWYHEGVADADPYTEAHISRLGILPMTVANQLSFTATRDSSGKRLNGRCTYEIKGVSPAANWWNIAIFQSDGQIAPHKTERYSFNSNTILTAPDGRYVVRLSPDVQPGNWLPAPRQDNLVLKLNILRPVNASQLLEDASELLPHIALVDCT